MIQALPLPPESLRRALHEALPEVAQGDWQPLFGGRTNSAWSLTVAEHGAPLVVKLYRSPARNPLFPNDQKAEATLLHHLGSAALDDPIAPRLRASFATEAGDCNVYDLIPGSRWQSGAEDVARLMLHLHGLSAPTGLRRIPDGSAALQEEIEAILAQCQQSEALRALMPAETVAPSGQSALLHCDIVPGNLIRNDSGLHLIDWQCPGIGDPCEDIAIFLSPAMQTLYRGAALSTDEQARFFAALDDPTLVARYQALAAWYHLRMAAYCQWQLENGQPDYARGVALEIAALERLGE